MINYTYNLMTGYHYNPPFGIDVPEGRYFNPYFDHMITGMPRQLHDGMIEYDDGTDIFSAATIPRDFQTASLTVRYRGGLGIANIAQGPVEDTDIRLSLPELELAEANRITFTTLNLQAGDNWGEGFIQVEEWIQVT